VAQSGLAGYAEGDPVVTPDGGWQDYAVSDGGGLRRLSADTAQPSLALGMLGMTGFTAWWGLTAIGVPQAGETLVVSAAAGAVGSAVGQIGRLLGCKVVGIAGGAKKCRLMTEKFGFDACVDYRAPDFQACLAAAAPMGVDIYFENVGGAVREAVWPLLNQGARVPVCGLVANYNGAAEGAGAGALVDDMLMSLVIKRIRLQGFMNADHIGAFDTFEAQMRGWLEDSRLRAVETVVQGLGQAPQAFIGLFRGDNIGKLVVQVEA
jgi:NADPH-dependent curcumin reductase CurA